MTTLEPDRPSTASNDGRRLALVQYRYVTICSAEHACGGIKNVLHDRRYKTFIHSTTCLYFTSRQPMESFLLCYNTLAFNPEHTVYRVTNSLRASTVSLAKSFEILMPRRTNSFCGEEHKTCTYFIFNL
jgi:hypothetical protein